MTRITSLCLGVIFLLLLNAVPAFSQIQFKLQWMPDSLAWGVFAKPEYGYSPSMNTMIGSGQVTVVSPPGYAFSNLKCYSGTWSQNAYINAPAENPGRDYVSFGFVSEDPPLRLQTEEETLLFTFQKKNEVSPDTLYLISANDPFNKIPNSANANPGNDISVMDLHHNFIFYYSGNYAPEAWNCHPGKEVPQGPFRQGGQKSNGGQVNRP